MLQSNEFKQEMVSFASFVAAWRRPQDAPGSMERIEDDPVLPGARHGEETI